MKKIIESLLKNGYSKREIQCMSNKQLKELHENECMQKHLIYNHKPFIVNDCDIVELTEKPFQFDNNVYAISFKDLSPGERFLYNDKPCVAIEVSNFYTYAEVR